MQNQLVLDFEPETRNRPEYLEFTRMLGLNPDKLVYPVVVVARGGAVDSINLRFRSFAGVMYLLSQPVQIPDEDAVALDWPATGRQRVPRICLPCTAVRQPLTGMW